MTLFSEYDPRTNYWWGYFKEFPECSAVADTEEELKSRLYELVLGAVTDSKELIVRLIELYGSEDVKTLIQKT
jgi:predicted RNase H-like HicB family nuclease